MLVEDSTIYDQNKYPGDPVALVNGGADTMSVDVKSVGKVAILSLKLISPPGATDSTLSTGQSFVLQAKVRFSGSLKAGGRQAEVIFPPSGNFALEDTSTVKKFLGGSVLEDSVVWQIRAPENILTAEAKNTASAKFLSVTGQTSPEFQVARGGEDEEDDSSESIKELLGQLYSIDVRAQAVEKNTGEIRSATSSVDVTVQEKAQLSLDAQIVSPPGAMDRILSTYQSFALKITVNRLGEAQTVGDSKVRVRLPAGFSFGDVGGSRRDSLFSIFENTSATVSVYSDSIAHSNIAPLVIWISEPAFDVNTNDTAQVLIRQKEFDNLKIVKRANLVLTSQTQADSLAKDQQFEIQAVVKNRGTAGVLPVDSVWVNLRYDTTGFEILSADTLQRVQLSDTARWMLKARGIPGKFKIFPTIEDNVLYDENNYSSIRVFKSDSLDTLELTVIDLGDIAIKAFSFPGSTDSTRILTSTDQDSILLRLVVQNNPLFPQNRLAMLTLPSGISSLNNLQQPVPANGVVEWYLNVSGDTTNGYQSIQVKAEATSNINGSTVEKFATVSIKTITKATLSLSARVTDPPGAMDDTVSYGQEFTLRALVQKNGAAPVVGTGVVQVAATNDSLQIWSEATSSWVTSLAKPFSADTPVFWKIKADTNQVVSRILRKIQNLQAQKILTRQQTFSVNEGGSNPFVEAKSQIEADIRRLSNDLNQHISRSMLRTTIQSALNDSLTGKPAFVARALVETDIVIQPMTELHILASSVVAPSRVSTNQVFTVRADIATDGEISPQREAKLVIPGFQIPDAQKFFTGNRVSWQVTAPANAPQVQTLPDSIIVWAVDLNSGETRADTFASSLVLEQEAVVGISLKIISPPSAVGGRLSFNQIFNIKATVHKSGNAGLTGTGEIKLNYNPQELELLNQPNIKSFTWPDSTVEWVLKTPERIINSQLKVSFAQVPSDVNTGDPAKIDPQNSAALVGISTEVHRLRVTRVPEFAPTKINRQSDTRIPLFGLEFNNEKTSDFIPTVQVDSLTLVLFDSNGDTISNPGTVLSSIEIVNPARAALSKTTGTPRTFATLNLGPSTPGLIPVKFNTAVMELAAGVKDTMVVLVNISDNSPNKSFRMRITDIHAVEISTRNLIQLVDQNGNLWNPENASGLSNTLTVIFRDESKIFGNYPNPFNNEDGFTRFVFWMEDGGSAELRIYTLLGGLVWSKKIENLSGDQTVKPGHLKQRLRILNRKRVAS
ncbi:hypothetical protein B1H10_05475 [candidate division KSB1 bacterium 4484_188]|nr:MAG: hypothetical protein B1H10_05475 [candidate division KSB1 bacterium 4484_188]